MRQSKDPKDHVPDHDLNEPTGWTDEDQDELDDWNQHLEDLEQEED